MSGFAVARNFGNGQAVPEGAAMPEPTFWTWLEFNWGWLLIAATFVACFYLLTRRGLAPKTLVALAAAWPRLGLAVLIAAAITAAPWLGGDWLDIVRDVMPYPMSQGAPAVLVLLVSPLCYAAVVWVERLVRRG